MNDWYKPSPKIEEFHASTAYVRFLLGGRGSSKTTSLAKEAIKHCFHTPGGRVILLRKTKESQRSTSVETFNETYDKEGFEDAGDDTSLFRKWDGGLYARIPTYAAIQKYNDFMKRGPRKSEIQAWMKTIGRPYCAFIEFHGLKDEKISENTLRGLECTMLGLIEADMLTLEDFRMALQCLRRKDAYGNHVADKNCVVETNPPGPSHWIAQIEKAKNETDAFQDYAFWHLKTADNEHNLDPGDPNATPPRLSYLESLKRDYAGNPAMYARMVEGEYSEAHPGNPVFHRFNISRHSAKELPWVEGGYLIRIWDFGVFNAVAWAEYFERNGNEYLWFMAEQYLEGSDIDKQADEAIKLTEEQFPFWNNRDICAGVKDYADPTGQARTGHGKKSYFQVLHTHSIYPGFRYLDLAPSISIVNRALNEFDAQGQAMIMIDSEACPLIFAAFSGKYRYPAKGEAGWGADNAAPVKGDACDNIDHIADCARYGIHNVLRLAKTKDTKAKAAVGKLANNYKSPSIDKNDMYGKRKKPSVYNTIR
jgi:hypothetical protein